MVKTIDRDMAIAWVKSHRSVSDNCLRETQEICNLMHDQIIDLIECLPAADAIENNKVRLKLARLRMNYKSTDQEARTAYLTALMDVERELFGDPGEAGR